MREIWKDIKGFEGVYMVSNLGRVKGLARISSDNRDLPDRYLTGSKYSNGYCMVKLSLNGKRVRKSIHRLVAEAFIPNPDGLPMINHKDEDKTNNKADNLEWCDARYNSTYGTCRMRGKETFIKNNSNTVYQFALDGSFIAEYNTITTAARATGAQESEICACCNRYEHSISSGGYIWRFAKDCPEKSVEPYSIKPSSLRQKVSQYSLQGEWIRDYECINEAVRLTGTRHSSIYACCVGKYKTANGYKWKYK